MTVEEAKGVCKDRNQWKEVISVAQRETSVMLCIYVCTRMYMPYIHNLLQFQLIPVLGFIINDILQHLVSPLTLPITTFLTIILDSVW
jgi:hypothetical protein